MKEHASSPAAGRGPLRPRSIIGLVLMAFAVVALPLIIAIGTGLFYVDRLYQQSERLVLQGVTVTRETRRLSSLLIDMERSARQYQVLGTPALLSRFSERSDAFAAALDALAEMTIPTLDGDRLLALADSARRLPEQLGADPEHIEPVIAQLAQSRTTSEAVADRGREFVRRELGALKATAATARRVMLVCLFALVPIVIVLAILLGFVIARPLRQIVAAIRRVGEGRVQERIVIGAPVAELDRIGERLDWMRARLADQEQQKQQFLRHMSHELKTPLASIREGANLLADGSLGALSVEQKEVAGIVDASTRELTGLVDNLLNYAAWQQTHTRLETERCDVAELIRAQIARHRLSQEARGLTIEHPEAPVLCDLDRERVVLIIDNLLTNALKYAPAESVVRFVAERSAQGLDLYCMDDGPGVPMGERARIFQAFVRGSARHAAQAHISGTGIGLSVVRECAEAHGGYADIVDDEHHSSVFHVYVPHPHPG